MNKILIAGLIAIFATVALIWYFNRPAPVRNYPSQGTDIVAFGDSLVEGVGASSQKDFVSLLSAQIGEPIHNLGVAGNTTADGLARIDDLDEYNPRIVILLLGGNDYLRRVPPETTFYNLGKIIEELQSRGAMVLLLGVRGGVLSDNFADQYQDLSEMYETAYVPNVLDGLLGHQEYMYDSIHPNDTGYARIADRIAPVLERLLR
jgi:acyl-CoA thioesterase-1